MLIGIMTYTPERLDGEEMKVLNRRWPYPFSFCTTTQNISEKYTKVALLANSLEYILRKPICQNIFQEMLESIS